METCRDEFNLLTCHTTQQDATGRDGRSEVTGVPTTTVTNLPKWCTQAASTSSSVGDRRIAHGRRFGTRKGRSVAGPEVRDRSKHYTWEMTALAMVGRDDKWALGTKLAQYYHRCRRHMHMGSDTLTETTTQLVGRLQGPCWALCTVLMALC